MRYSGVVKNNPVPTTVYGGPHDPVATTPAIWLTRDENARLRPGVTLFRRALRISARGPASLWITACQTYELFVDGVCVARGPSRSDPWRWPVREVALTLRPGRRQLAVRVTQFGELGGVARMGGPAFLLIVPGRNAGWADRDWRALADPSWSPVTTHAWGAFKRHDVVGCGDRWDGARHPWGWAQARFDDRAWPTAVELGPAWDPWGNTPLEVRLTPEIIPPLATGHHTARRLLVATSDGAWEPARLPLRIAARARARLLVDQGELINACPAVTVSGGAGAEIELVSAEAPYRPGTRDKAPRDDIAGNEIRGHRDVFVADGGRARTFGTLTIRNHRYLELRLHAGAQPLTIERIAATTLGYPLRRRRRVTFNGPDAALWRRMEEVSWRTARLCAHDLIFDCPFYEQCQFPGDARVQAIYHYLVADDDRLVRKAIADLHASRLPDGQLQCRYPSRRVQVLATYSWHWVGLLRDFLVYRGDADFARPFLHLARETVAAALRRRRADGLPGRIDDAPFLDWSPAFQCGNAPQDADGGSIALACLLAQACDWLVELERGCGLTPATEWTIAARALRMAARRAWDPARGLLRDTAGGATFSVHTQVEAILAGVWPAARARAVLRRALADPAAAQPGSHYYRFFVAQAMLQCGWPEGTALLIPAFQRSLDGTGLTTWPESDGPARSDCHGWSVLPAILARWFAELQA